MRMYHMGAVCPVQAPLAMTLQEVCMMINLLSNPTLVRALLATVPQLAHVRLKIIGMHFKGISCLFHPNLGQILQGNLSPIFLKPITGGRFACGTHEDGPRHVKSLA